MPISEWIERKASSKEHSLPCDDRINSVRLKVWKFTALRTLTSTARKEEIFTRASKEFVSGEGVNLLILYICLHERRFG